MRNKIITIIAIFFSILFVDNVKAEGYVYNIPDTLIPVFENYTFNTWNTTSESSNYNKFKKQIDDVLNKKTSIECVNEIVDNYSNYIFIYGNGNNRAIFWNGNDYEARFGGGYGSYWSMGKQVNGTKIGLYNSISTGNEKVIYLPSDGNYVCSNDYFWTDKQATSTTPLLSYTLQGSNVPNDIINNYNNGYFPTIYTNQDIKVGNYYDGETTADFGVSVSYAYDSFTLNGKTYNVDDVIIPRNDTVIPKITFSTTENKETINGEEIVTSKDITIDFGEIDNTKYLYLVSLDGGENWQTYTLTQNTSTTINVKDNCTVIAQILKLSDSSYVTSATQTITGITYIDPNTVYISFDKVDSKFCISNINGEDYQICAVYDIYFSIVDYDKYKYYISTDSINFEEIEPFTELNYYTYAMQNNGTLFVKVLNADGSFNSSNSLVITGLGDKTNLGQYVTFTKELSKIDIYVRANIVNYMPNDYNYIIKKYITNIDGVVETKDVTNDVLCLEGGCGYPVSFDSDGKLQVDITDKQGNLIATYETDVDYTKDLIAATDDPFDKLVIKFNSKFGIFKQLITLFKNIFGTHYDEEMPEFKITIYGVTMNIVDFEPFALMRLFIQGLIIFFSYFFFLKHLIYSIPNIIGGTFAFDWLTRRGDDKK